MLESYLLTTDGKEYVDVDCVREALGIVDEYVDFLGAIRKMREERDSLKENLRVTEHALKTVKKERDNLKDRLRTYRFIANGTYGDSCGYSGNKAPAFLCNVISYSWELGSIRDTDSIRVELELTPTANYKGTFDMEDLKKYIQAYGREKKLGIIESVDYQNAKVARAELAYLYNINEEYKRVVHNFEERTVDWSKAQQELDRYARFRSNVCTALCLGGETSDADILERIRKTRECHDKLCKDYTKLHDDYVASQKQVKGFTNRCDSLENLQRDLWEFRKNAIEDLKNRGFFFRPEENETLPEIYDKLLKRYDDYFSRYKEQYRLRQMWHVRWESENERANGVQKALDREREKCRVKDISLETAKKQYEKVCGNLETAECALNGMKSKIRELQKENAGLKKDVASLTGDTSVDLYEEETDGSNEDS